MKSNLPIINTHASIQIGADALEKCFQLLTLDTADYFLEKLEKIKKNQPDLYEKVTNLITDFKLINSTNSQYWNGKDYISKQIKDFKNLQSHIASNATSNINAIIPVDNQVEMIFSLNDSAQFLRAYLVNGEPIDTNSDLAVSLDQKFNGWLATNNMASNDGLITKIADDKAKINIKNLKELISSTNKIGSFHQYLTKTEINLIVNEQLDTTEKAQQAEINDALINNEEISPE